MRNAFQPIPDLIRRAGVTGRWGLLSQTGKLFVYKFTVLCIVYSEFLLLTKYIDSLQQLAITYCYTLTNQWVINIFCTVESLLFNQSESYYTVAEPISELLHSCTVDSLFFNQLESYYTVAEPISELLHFLALFRCTRKTYYNTIWNLLHCWLWCSHMIVITLRLYLCSDIILQLYITCFKSSLM